MENSFAVRTKLARAQDPSTLCETGSYTISDDSSSPGRDTPSASDSDEIIGEDRENSQDSFKSLPYFEDASRPLRLPEQWAKHLRIHGAMFVIDHGEEITINWLSCMRHRHPDMGPKDLSDLILQSFVDPDYDEVDQEGEWARHPSDTIQIKNSVWDADTIILGYDETGEERSLAWWLNPSNRTEDHIIDIDDFYLFAKSELDLSFHVQIPSQSSFWVMNYMEGLDPAGKMAKCDNLEIQYNHRDGRAHHWTYYPLGVDFGCWSLDGGDRPAEVDGDSPGGGEIEHLNFNSSREIRELDTPDVVYEGVCSLVLMARVPDLYGSQARALTLLAGKYIRKYGHKTVLSSHNKPSEHNYHTDNTKFRLSQVLFLLEWNLSLKRLSTILQRDYCSLPACVAPSKRCEIIIKFLQLLQDAFTKSIVTEAMIFVLHIIADGTLETLNDPNSRVERMQMWCTQMNKTWLSQTFIVLSPGVDINELLEIPEWYRYLEIVLARLADDLLLLQLCRKGGFEGPDAYQDHPSGMLGSVGQFYNCVRGRDVGRHLEIPAEMPPPVHESLVEYLEDLTTTYVDQRDADERCFSMEFSLDMYSDLLEANYEWRTTCTGHSYSPSLRISGVSQDYNAEMTEETRDEMEEETTELITENMTENMIEEMTEERYEEMAEDWSEEEYQLWAAICI